MHWTKLTNILYILINIQTKHTHIYILYILLNISYSKQLTPCQCLDWFLKRTEKDHREEIQQIPNDHNFTIAHFGYNSGYKLQNQLLYSISITASFLESLHKRIPSWEQPIKCNSLILPSSIKTVSVKICIYLLYAVC